MEIKVHRRCPVAVLVLLVLVLLQRNHVVLRNLVNLDDFNVIISFSILKDILKEVGNCPECNCGVTVTSDEAKRRGFAHNVEIKCASCQYSYSTYTSGTVDRNTNMTKASTKGRKTFDINLRMIVAFREIGRGHEPLISFSRIANLSCMHVNAFQKQ